MTDIFLKTSSLIVIRGGANFIIPILILSNEPTIYAASIFFIITLVTQVRGAAELNLSNYLVMATKNKKNVTTLIFFQILLQIGVLLPVVFVFYKLEYFELDLKILFLVLFLVVNQGVWGMTHAINSTIGKFRDGIFFQTILILIVAGGLYFNYSYMIHFLIISIVLGPIFLFTRWKEYANHISWKEVESVSAKDIKKYSHPFFVNNSFSLVFSLLLPPFIFQNLSSEHYIWYGLGLQIVSGIVYIYKGLSKKILSYMLDNRESNFNREIYIVLSLLSLLLVLSYFVFQDKEYIELLRINETSVVLGLVLLSSSAGLLSLLNIHQNLFMQSVMKNWLLVRIRIFSNFLMGVLVILWWLSQDRLSYQVVVLLEILTMAIVTYVTFVFLSRDFKKCVE